ncbi:hypothetical protein [Urechidicola croceus]|uniref:Peptidoglycan-binding protein LysM n=1 Tax=Urechidicola croceus TaxID=1850246 RepID=A0A1D8P3L6_9FLAO|nr:hypothetical protein [Urechidicola croceus]AOW19169.1 hypothetical protein LPB138_00020 [Urechidicola croceus]
MIKPLRIKKTTLILGLVIVTILSSSFSKKENSSSIYDENCVRPTQLSTVLTLEECERIINVPFTGSSFIGFKEAVGFKESRNRYHIVNKFGYMGKYQFGKSTLRRLKIYNVENFLRNPEQQERAFMALCSLNKHILRNDIKRSVGKKINGFEITESGILAAAHLGGAGNVKKFLRSGGNTNFSDAFGSSIQYYMKKFSGFDVSSIEASKNPLI